MVDQLTPAQILGRIRYDPLTKKGSVYDVIQLVTGCRQNHAPVNFQRIGKNFPEMSNRVSSHKFPGQGQRPTPVADMPTLFRLMAMLPGSRSRNFAGKSMDVFTRAFGGDERLGNEIAKRRKMLAGTAFEHVAANITTTVDDALAELGKPLDPPADDGVIYIATSPLLPFFKLGYWTGSQEALESRFKMYYGPETEVQTWPCNQCRACEAFMLDELASFSMGGELFTKHALPAAMELLKVAASM